MLEQLVTLFKKSKEKNLQLDFFRDNGEVLLQFFKGYDIKTWEKFIPNINEGKVLIQILFHKDKTNNNLNYKRFLDYGYPESFVKVDFHNQNTYFKIVESDFIIKNFMFELEKILQDVYGVKIEHTKYTLNAY